MSQGSPIAKLSFELGTIVLEQISKELAERLPGLEWDKRTLQWRAPARYYREIVLVFHREQIPLNDAARSYDRLSLALAEPIVPRDHQSKALAAWRERGASGVVSLPTGAGKTILAILAIVSTNRPTLVVVPTIDLLHQWHALLTKFLARPIGALGGGQRDIQDIMVSTYDSAALQIEFIGNRFGLVVFDECHHLPAPQYQMIAHGAIAPFRLGLSATVERADGKESLIYELVGPLVYEGQIRDMVAKVLAPYDVINVEVPMSDQEYEAYQTARKHYTDFIKRYRISFSGPGGWMEFVKKAAVYPGGQEAMRAYREQKRLSQASETKISELWRILLEHQGERIIVFTDDNALAYRIGRELVLPVLTHQTKPKERKQFLDGFREGELDVLVTSRVLNEGVDVPEASIGVVVSGSGTVREHVQRLGRILRHRPGKRAVLYEIVSKGTSEFYVNKRRRQHHAYQRSAQV